MGEGREEWAKESDRSFPFSLKRHSSSPNPPPVPWLLRLGPFASLSTVVAHLQTFMLRYALPLKPLRSPHFSDPCLSSLQIPVAPFYRVLKLLSVDPSNYEDAPREGIRRILQEVR